MCTVTDSENKVTVWPASELEKVSSHKEETCEADLTDDIVE